MFIIYDLIFLVISIIYLPIYLLRGKFNRGFWARLGVLSKDLHLASPIWIHAVSVGEAQAVRVLAEELRREYPAKKLVISTVTATGNKIANTIAKAEDFVTYLPLDFSFFVKNVIDEVKPAVFILAETEIWPNLISYLYKKHIPIIVVNARISDASFKGYSRIEFLAKPILNKITFFCAQTERDAERLRALGVAADRIKVTGNMKFDTTDYTDKKSTDYTDYKIKLGLKNESKLWVCGSTHPGEEKDLLDIYKELLEEFPFLKLLIAPRHPERSAHIAELIKKDGFLPVKISLLNRTTGQPDNGKRVFILDTIGELGNYYACADIVFVGGSLVKKGGHNILEPAACAKPVLFGPHMFNFRDIAELFLSKEAAILVEDKETLEEAVKDLLADPYKSAQLSRRAKELIENNRGSSMRNLEVLKSKLLL